jgi:hypothetical protein
MSLGNVDEAEGNLDKAFEQFTVSLALLRRNRGGSVGPSAGLAALNLASILVTRGECDEALEMLPLVIPNARAYPLWVTLLVTAQVARATGDLETATVLHGAVGPGIEGAGASAGDMATQLHRDDLEALRSDASVDFDRLYGSGRRMTEDEALRLATQFVAQHQRHFTADALVNHR